MNSPYPFFGSATGAAVRRPRDITWDRILFQPPVLNPRMVFDPLPFRTQTLPRPQRSRSPFHR
ncbi:hypothetical protein ESB00_14565 [Oleiharenicola lentus]|uniref:Uncharacterized protein n=1 Tax=Oleiharenicola lentus TaxID=2508720 RepID=A0A4Q1C3L5_9BACT|nr:hypothetical protein [Oleiharenicola lentus]RXK52932.1 hypothetical protein ESB00_14565 [Oleiharenicola lentus]